MNGSGDGTDFQSGVPDEQQRKISGTNEGTGAKPRVLDVPKYFYESDKVSWGDSGEEDDDDDKDDTEDDEGNDDGDDSDHERTESDRDENPNLNQSIEEYEEKEEENVDEFTYKEDDTDNAKEENEEELDDAEELYKDVNKTKGHTQSSSVSSEFTEKLLNFKNVSPVNNEIDSFMDTTVRHEEPSGHTSSLYTVPVTVIPEITFNDRVTNLERDLSEMKQVDQEEAIPDRREYIDLIDTSVRAVIKEEVNSQLPQVVSEFATPVIEQNITESLEAAVLAKSSSQPKSTYEATASLFEFEMTKILMDKMEEHKSYLRADYKRELYDALVKSYNTDKDLFVWMSWKDVYSRKCIIALTSLTIMKRYDYGHLDEIKVRREDQQLYKFKECDFPRLRLQDIEDMLLLLVQQKLTNLTIDEHFDLNVALRMFTRRIVIQRRVEDLQLGIESYQKKLKLTKPDTFRLNLRNRTTYTAYLDPQGVIYKDQNKKNRLMRTDELHKSSDGMLNDVWTAVHDITSGIRMEYLPKRKWSGLDKQRARVMIQDIDKQLF
ncbi:hypothetical protein Tco_1516641 [Tanacetum coccineum]